VFDDVMLRNHLEAHLDDKLKVKVRHSEARKDTNFKTWVAAIHLLDEARAVENKRQHELIEETLQQRQAKRQNSMQATIHSRAPIVSL
jgi:hypothetical protein